MPPVLGPWSPSPTRLKSWAGASGMTVLPSQRQNSETSGPSRNSSTTTTPPSLARHASAWASASARSSVTTTPLPAARPSSLTTWGAPRASSASATSSRVWQTRAIAVGTSAAAITSFANDLLPSSWAACADGPNATSPASRTTSATPATSGASGPMTTRSTVCRRASSTIPSPSRTPPGSASHRAMASIPGLPGATITASTSWSAPRALTMACSRAPEPITRTFTGPA